MTLAEFVTDVGRGQHFRVYQPNADCLVYESFLTIHSPYILQKDFEYNPNYYNNNHYCPDANDAATEILLKKFGSYEIFRLEASTFVPHDMYHDQNGTLRVRHLSEHVYPCCDLYIVPVGRKK